MTTHTGDGFAVGNFQGITTDWLNGVPANGTTFNGNVPGWSNPLGFKPVQYQSTNTFQNPAGRPTGESLGIPIVHKVLAFDGTPVVASNTALAASATLSGAVTLSAGTGVTSATDSFGHTIFVFDYPRTVSITSGADVSARTITFNGYDRYGRKMTETVTGPNTTTVNGKKAFAAIYTATTSGSMATTSIGYSTIIGLPYFVPAVQYLQSWGGSATVVTLDGGTVVTGDTTATQTATTGDVLGTYSPSLSFNGTLRLTIYQVIQNWQIALSGQFLPAYVYGITPFTAW